MTDFNEDLRKLGESSPLAKQFDNMYGFKDCKIIDIDSKSLDGFSFHPTGDCGCIVPANDYMFGIKCNPYLMWSDGFCEGVEPFLSAASPAILLYANHKGNFVMKLIYLE
jgi:hypothetical protein